MVDFDMELHRIDDIQSVVDKFICLQDDIEILFGDQVYKELYEKYKENKYSIAHIFILPNHHLTNNASKYMDKFQLASLVAFFDKYVKLMHDDA